MKTYNNFPLPELSEDDKLNELIGSLYEVDGYLAGALSLKNKNQIKKGIEYFEELRQKIENTQTVSIEKKTAIDYINESIRISKLNLV
jgi:hypothetical protein